MQIERLCVRMAREPALEDALCKSGGGFCQTDKEGGALRGGEFGGKGVVGVCKGLRADRPVFAQDFADKEKAAFGVGACADGKEGVGRQFGAVDGEVEGSGGKMVLYFHVL